MKIDQYVNQSLILAIGFSYDLIWRDLNDRLKNEGCNLLHAMILIAVFFEANDAVTPSVLAKTFRTTRGNISHGISHLEKLGYLKRMLDENDARSYRLSLKPEGKKCALRLIKVLDELENFFEKRAGKSSVNQVISRLNELSQAYLEFRK